MDLFKDVLSQIKDLQNRLRRLESSNQVQQIATNNGTIILNASGLTSSNFPLHQVTGNGGTTTNTTQTDVPGSSLNPFTTTAASTSVQINVVAFGYNPDYNANGSSMQVYVIDSVDGDIIDFSVTASWYLTSIAQDGSKNVTGWSLNNTSQVVTFPVVIQLSPGTHTLKLQYKVNGTGTAILPVFYLGYIIEGQQT